MRWQSASGLSALSFALVAVALPACAGAAGEGSARSSENGESTLPVAGEQGVDEELPDPQVPSEPPDARQRCIAAYRPSEYDVGGTADERDAQEPEEAVTRTLEDVVAECELDSGMDCNSTLISSAAARCIAEAEKLAPGLRPWEVGLGYNYGRRRISWGISSLLEESAEGSRGMALSLNAVDGTVLDLFEWRSINN